MENHEFLPSNITTVTYTCDEDESYFFEKTLSVHTSPEVDTTLVEIDDSGLVLSAEDAINLAAHLIATFQSTVDPSVMESWGKAMVTDAQARKPKPKRKLGYASLSTMAQKVYQHMNRAGSISAREAMADYSMSGNTLSRRITDITEAGFHVERERRKHPLTGNMYTRYSLLSKSMMAAA
ncbi:MAG: helix-turn-helix domain-containing protein [Pseudomonadota bacterium]